MEGLFYSVSLSLSLSLLLCVSFPAAQRMYILLVCILTWHNLVKCWRPLVVFNVWTRACVYKWVFTGTWTRSDGKNDAQRGDTCYLHVTSTRHLLRTRRYLEHREKEGWWYPYLQPPGWIQEERREEKKREGAIDRGCFGEKETHSMREREAMSRNSRGSLVRNGFLKANKNLLNVTKYCVARSELISSTLRLCKRYAMSYLRPYSTLVFDQRVAGYRMICKNHSIIRQLWISQV